MLNANNPIYCLDCNREVAPERLALAAELADDLAGWRSVHGAIEMLELDSGPYELWAQEQLLDPASATNAEGLALARRVNDLNRCYFWFFDAHTEDGWTPRAACPICGGPLQLYERGIFPQLLCERDGVVVTGE
jgi:hypothetical protein